MRLSDFKFKLPDEQIAQFPTAYRDDARLMVVHRKSGEIEHRQVRDTASYFDEGDLFVFNNTASFPARLWGTKEKTNANIEIFLLRELNRENKYWDVLVDPARKIRIGNKILFEDEPAIIAEVIDNTTSRGRTFRFLTDYTADELKQRLFEMGTTPVPKYIRRPMDEKTQEAFDEEFRGLSVTEMDIERYQSIFASRVGAVAAPASNLHFSKQLLKRLEIRGVEYTSITNHIGLGNFRPVDVEDLTKHKVDSEQVFIERNAVEAVDRAHAGGHRICAVGTEIMRAMEHVAGTGGRIKEYDGWTNKFIYPPYNFSVASAFFCNFYFPLTCQLMEVAAFGGHELIMKAYNEALAEGYMWGDYGDAMLIVD